MSFPAPSLPPPAISLLGHVSDEAIAALHSVPLELVTAERERRQISASHGGQVPRGQERRSVRIQVLVTPGVAARIDGARAALSRSDWGAAALLAALEGAR